MATGQACNDSEDSDIKLSEREIEVMRLIMEGKSSKEAAAILCCSKRTVDFHLAKVYSKLDVSNRVQAILRATSMGLMPEDEGDIPVPVRKCS